MEYSIDLTQYKPNNFVVIANDIPYWPLVINTYNMPNLTSIDPMIVGWAGEGE